MTSGSVCPSGTTQVAPKHTLSWLRSIDNTANDNIIMLRQVWLGRATNCVPASEQMRRRPVNVSVCNKLSWSQLSGRRKTRLLSDSTDYRQCRLCAHHTVAVGCHYTDVFTGEPVGLVGHTLTGLSQDTSIHQKALFQEQDPTRRSYCVFYQRRLINRRLQLTTISSTDT